MDEAAAPERGARDAKRLAVALIAVASAMMLLLVATYYRSYSLAYLYPPDEERYDIAELRLAFLADVCGGTDTTSRAALERCTRQLKLDQLGWRRLKIPVLRDLLGKGYPRFGTLLEEQGLGREWERIQHGETYLLGMEIPRRYVTVDDLGTFEHHALSIYWISNARLCLEGRCGQSANYRRYLVYDLPLLVERTPEAEMVPVFLVAKESGPAYGLNFGAGLFVASDKALWSFRSRGPIVAKWEIVFYPLLMLGFFVTVIGFAVFWLQFPDFAALLYFAASLAYRLNQQFVTELLQKLQLSEETTVRVAVFLYANLTIAAIVFAMTLARHPGRRVALAWSAQLVLVAGLSWAAVPSGLTSYAGHVRASFLPIALACLVLPTGISLAAALSCWRRWRATAAVTSKPGPDALALRSRFRQQLGFALFFAAMGAQLTYDAALVLDRNLWGTNSPPPYAAFGLFAIFAVMLYVSTVLVRRKLSVAQSELVEQAREAAIGRTIQMLAHDVRRPFSLVRAGMRILAASQSMEQLREGVARLTPEVERALRSVDGMLRDVMEIGSRAALVTEAARPEDLIVGALREVVAARRAAAFEVSWDLGHGHLLQVDGARLTRVLVNLVENAVQAMGPAGGRLWFRTRDAADGVLVTVGNAGSFVPPEDRARIFEAFYTKGKKGGTGLGLAIAKKIVAAHGGAIWCDSDRTRGTEFHLRLPRAAAAATPQDGLPTRSGELAPQWLEATPAEAEPAASGLERELREALASRGAPLKVLIVEDEEIYAAEVKRQLLAVAGDQVHVRVAATAEEGERYGRADRPALVICDIDLRGSERDGYELIARLRAAGVDAVYCVHSNRALPEDLKLAAEAGASTLVPKPMAREHLLRLLVEAAGAAAAA